MANGTPDLGRDQRVDALVQRSVRADLRVTNGMLGLGLSDEALDALAEGVVAGLDYAFKIDWSPDWVPAGGVHHWLADGQHIARCGVCLRDSPPMDNLADAEVWAHAHEESH